MTVISSELDWNGWNGSIADGGKREWSIVYVVITNNKNDGPQQVLAGYTGPMPGQQGYGVGNDHDAEVICQSVTPTRVGDSRTVWKVTARFVTPPDQKNETVTGRSGKPATRPHDFRPTVEAFPQKVQVPVEEAWNLKAFPGRKKETKGAVTSSAGEIFVPPPEKDESRWLWKLNAWRDNFPQWVHYQDTVNKDEVQIRCPRSDWGGALDIVQRFDKYTLKVESIGGRLEYVNNRSAWNMSFELLFRKDGWRPSYLDKGVLKCARDGDHTGHGGTFASSTNQQTNDQSVDINDGAAQQMRIVDPLGTPLDAPVMLDGKGCLLAKDKKPVYLDYRIYEERDLQAIINIFLTGNGGFDD